ncbi:transketolase family protein [Marinivivus vitaminiproducens]|uniref:transketolase family protein n=1 Tax=Marinivivus vitaminiproducens TaxID=3035935 RepID=UPI0027A3F08C|nr:transketolase C-terminal domain-containing protein [Geminicoccaceae bacterium SCSIO 64248]
MRDAFIRALTEAALADPRIVLLTGDLGFGVLEHFEQRCPRQYVNAGVAEQNMTALAAGLALEGRVAFTYSIANFTTLRCLEQIRNDACYHEANVNIVSVGGGLSYGPLGPTHHATEDLAIMRALPGMVVFAPNDDGEVAAGLPALIDHPGPSYIRLDRASVMSPAVDDLPFALGRARRLREGDDVTLVACGGMAGEALAAAETLQRQGLSCRVLSMHTIRPLDTDALIEAAAETGGIVTIEEHSTIGGLGTACADALLDLGVAPHRFCKIALPSAFTTVVGSQAFLRRHYRIDAGAIAARVAALLGVTQQPRLTETVG